MTENLLKEAMDCGWVTMGIRVPPPPPTWNFVVDFSKRWSSMDEGDFLDVLDVRVHWDKFIQQRPGGAYTAHVRVASQYRVDKGAFETDVYLPPIGTKPDEEWAKEVARLAVEKAIDKGWLETCEMSLASGLGHNWRNWRNER